MTSQVITDQLQEPAAMINFLALKHAYSLQAMPVRLKMMLTSLCILLMFTGCASKFPTPANQRHLAESKSGPLIFAKTLNVHGGGRLSELRNVNIGITGKWKQLIRRIQPLVSDFNYRVDSQERLLPAERVYAVNYSGPKGSKHVFRAPNSIYVEYNDEASSDSQVLSSTALTADAFHLFLLGPLALAPWQDQFTRLEDRIEKGTTYQRIHLFRKPGFGYSAQDQVVLWVNRDNGQTEKVQITLEGHDTTKGAHVQVSYLDFYRIDTYLFPSKFFEEVKAPIAIDAHAWKLTGLDINRNYLQADLTDGNFQGAAGAPAMPLIESRLQTFEQQQNR